MIKGEEFHDIIRNVFEDVNGLHQSTQLQVNCPLCQQKEGLLYPDGKYNLEINTWRGVFRCWKCDEPRFSGSLGKLIRLFGNNADYELYKSYAGSIDFSFEPNDEYDDDIIIQLPNEMILFSNMDSGNLEHFEAYQYLILDRAISNDIILKYRLGFCLDGKYSKRIIVPSYDENGNVNYFISRNYDTANKKKKPYDNPKFNKDLIIFNEGYINWDSTVYLVEGVFEMFSLINSIPLLGKIMSIALFNKLKEIKPNIIIILDPDAYKDSVNLFYQIYSIYIGCEDRVKIIKLRYEKDLDLIRKKLGVEQVISCLYEARGLNVDDYFSRKMENANSIYDSRNIKWGY